MAWEDDDGMPAGTPRLLSVAQAARALGVSELTLRDWRVDRKNLAFVKVGDRICVDVREIERFIEQHTERPVARTVAKGRHGRRRSSPGGSAKTIDFPA
ncbi:MAG: helix-turn-helix domain-containing protein [Patescibacteria group bacterium]|nr:helix-turn-helix domain-containing protein [Patescibacteria group bacterium]